MRRGWIVWSVGVLAYVLAVMQRTTFGIAGLDAAERFAITPGALSTFVFVQVAVYLAAQIPAGIAVDRFGSRAMLVVSGVLLATGQLLLAVAPDLVTAVLARVLVGLGDAAVFTAVLALVPRWFPARRVPLLVQVTTILCQLGQVLSALPFAWVLHGAGWPSAFGAAAAGQRPGGRARARRGAGRARRRRGAPRRRARRCGRSSAPCARSGGGRAPGWASSATWAPSSP